MMRKREGSLFGLLVLGCSMLAGGCVDAFSQGLAAGLYDAMSTLVEDAIANAAAGIADARD